MIGDAGEDAARFIEWVYANPGKAPADYASELALLLTEHERKHRRQLAAVVLASDGYVEVTHRNMIDADDVEVCIKSDVANDSLRVYTRRRKN